MNNVLKLPPKPANWSGFDLRRERMVSELMVQGIKNQNVLKAMLAVPRHVFVEEALRSRAYDHMSLPLGMGQTISQPYTVAKMTELLQNAQGHFPKRILEIGTGCGYQTAVLYYLKVAVDIFSIERIPDLHEMAKCNLRKVQATSVRLVCADGYLGLPNQGQFDGIIVTAAPKEVPMDLFEQLAIGGRMVLPIDEGGVQYLWLIEKEEHGYRETCIQRVNFVPLVPEVHSGKMPLLR